MQLVATTTSFGDEIGDAGTLLDMLTTGRPWWHRAGACRTAPVHVSWFGANPHAAKQVCADCPVLAACRDWALEQDPTLDGVWGGLSRADRAVEHSRR